MRLLGQRRIGAQRPQTSTKSGAVIQKPHVRTGLLASGCKTPSIWERACESGRIVKDDAGGVAFSRAQTAHPMPHIDPISPARAGDRPMMHCEHGCLATSKWYDLGPRLHAWALLDEHELAA